MNVDIIKIKNFVKDWQGHGYEKGETQKFWLAFIRDVFDILYPEKFIDFETQVKIDGNTKFLDGYLFESKVIIEQKSSHVKLDDAVYQQAKRYNDALNYTRKARWIITCNFNEFLIYNMDTLAAPVKILFEELPEKYYAFDFLIKKTRRTIDLDRDLDFEAGTAVRKLYENMYKSYTGKDKRAILQNLNKLCVRLVFCFYAESAGIFPRRKMFTEYLSNYKDSKVSLRRALSELFEVLSTPLDKRSEFIGEDLKLFPYIDGGLFDEEKFDFPEFQTAARKIFFDMAKLKWQDIDPTIFGAVFESTLQNFDAEKNIRREEGIHYTSPENIQKITDPLFFDELYKKFQNVKTRADLISLQNEIAQIKILDPACGSGNFLTESYILLRELENSILELLAKDGVQIPDNPIKISIENFYGIEINDFAVAVAKTALWISEIQMRQKLIDALNLNLPHFPLKKIPHIICENALTFDWQKLIAPADLNFIVGNPPFIGTKGQNAAQKADILALCKDLKPLDYVTGWFKKAADFIQGSNVRCAFVATNSITQGEQVAPLWKNLNVHIDFAYRTFKWFSESPNMAQVHVVIIAFSQVPNLQKKIFEVTFLGKEKVDKAKVDDKDKTKTFLIKEEIIAIPARNINGYLFDAPNAYIEKRDEPVCDVPKMTRGSMPIDGGNLIIEADEYENFIKREPAAEKYIRQYMGADDFINGKIRYCLWLVDCPPNELRQMKLVMERVTAVKEFRLKSKRPDTQKAAVIPSLFYLNIQPETNYIMVPRVSSENRRYIPMGFIDKNIIASDATSIIPRAGLYEFGILTSSVHNAWARAVCGRLKSDYRYSATIVYNNFVWCAPTEKQRLKIESTAQKILDARAKYPAASLADLYDETAMPKILRAAHKENDAAVMAAYGFSAKMTEPEIVSALMEKYLQLTGKK
ncbi:MAG: restriction endonuclease subunit M [Selenomonadaceae bacterium]|nr:restriction endonuclease subunit M [Selenomonadaceae bacterium]